jgi:DNA-binding CsgD family transcriptional regulator
MGAVPDRVSEWVDVVADLLAQPVGVYPVEQIAAHLRRTFDSPTVLFSWRTENGVPGLVVPAPAGQVVAGRPVEDVRRMAEEALRSGVLDDHPLLRWYATTGRATAWSMGRVPAEVAGPATPAMQDLFESLEVRQQLSMPLAVCGHAHEAFVVTRPDRRDFDDDDLEVAQRVQRLLRALRVQASAIARALPAGSDAPTAALTGRELAVLGLLVQGFTATAIGHRLGMSPRTATKHIEHIYRKLGVTDRVSATLVAQRRRLVVPAVADRG